jgi:phospholipase D1/2
MQEAVRESNPSCTSSILVPGRSCWVKARAHRVSVLIDGAAYFASFKSAVEKAEKTIYIAGWDIDSRVSLLRDNPESVESSRLGGFLDSVVARKKDLRAYILIWDFSMVFALEREPFLVFKLDWQTHRRVHFRMDGNHPLGASHHQKMVVIDDSVAFAGGFDLSRARWDTPDHIVDDPRRMDPPGKIHDPFHDIQMVVDGDAARRLGDLFRRRWHQAEDEKLPPPGRGRTDLWPQGVSPDFRDVDMAIARTEPEYQGNSEVREVEQLYLDAISCAQKHIYVESQYLTSASIRSALEERLKEPHGPEILIIVPHHSSGWLEENIMDSRRSILLDRLRHADKFNRLGVYYPVLPGLEQGDMVIHSKLFIADDNLIRVGSSNLSNRSMGLDTECDLALEALGDVEIHKQIGNLRNRLMAEHLGTTMENVAETFEGTGSLIRTVEQLRGSRRTLKPLEVMPSQSTELIAAKLVDAERPIKPDQFIEQFILEDVGLPGKYHFWKVIVLLVVLGGLGALWAWGPLGEWITADMLVSQGTGLQNNPMAALVVTFVYVAGGLVMMPLVLLVVTTALIFEPPLSIAYAYLGCLASALVCYGVGRKVGRNSIRKLAGTRLNKISRLLARQSALTVATVRLVPVAPYSIVNMVMGAARVRLQSYIIGTVIGLAPGIITISLFTEGIHGAVSDTESWNYIIVIVAAFAAILGGIWLKRWISARSVQNSNMPQDTRRIFD